MSNEFLETSDEQYVRDNIHLVSELKGEDLAIFLWSWIELIPSLLDFECVKNYYHAHPELVEALLESDIRDELRFRDFGSDSSDEEIDDLPELIDLNAEDVMRYYDDRSENNRSIGNGTSHNYSSSCGCSSYGCETSSDDSGSPY
jgi:hypothetical protein